MRLHRVLVWIVVGSLLALVGGAGLAQPASIPVGFFAPLTGDAAADGASALHGAEMAVDAVNAKGGIENKPLKLITYDDRLDPKEAVAIANKLIEQDRVPVAVSGSYSGTTRAAAPIYQGGRTPLVVAYAAHPDITKAGDYIFRPSVLGVVEARAGAWAAARLLHASRVSILFMDNDIGRTYSAAFAEEAGRLGVKVVSSDVFPLGNKEYGPLLARIRGLGPDLLYAVAYYDDAAQIVRQARTAGIATRILGMQGYDSPKLIELAGNAAEGVLFTTTFNRDDPRPEVRTFLRGYRARYGILADQVAASGYTGVQLAAYALQRGGTDRARIKDALAALRNVSTVLGRLQRFTPQHEVVMAVHVQQVRGQDFHAFGTVADPAIVTPP